MKKLRGRWAPSPEQISLAIDCAVARMPITRAAELVGIKPRTLWLFAKRAGSPGTFEAWKGLPARVVASRAADVAAGIYLNGRDLRLGYFESPELARAAHAAAVKRHLGETYLKADK